MSRRSLWFFVMVFVFLAGQVFAQEPRPVSPAPAPPAQSPPPRTKSAWKYEFTVSEIEKGKTVNERTYFMMLLSDKDEGVRAGSQLPVVTNINNTTTTSFLMFGLRIICGVTETQTAGTFQSRIDFEMSSPVLDPKSSGGTPTIRTVGGNSTFIVHPGKKEVVISVDDVNTDRQYQVAVLATRLN